MKIEPIEQSRSIGSAVVIGLLGSILSGNKTAEADQLLIGLKPCCSLKNSTLFNKNFFIYIFLVAYCNFLFNIILPI